MFPGDIEKIGIRVPDFEIAGTQLMDKIDDTVLQVNCGESEDEGGDVIDQRIGVALELRGVVNSRVNLPQNLIVGP